MEVNVDFLIVGAGPAGASLACFLSSYGLRGIMVSSAPGTADTPRAHITNMATVECLRDIGLEEEVMRVGNRGDCLKHVRWCDTMAGEEYARVHAWGSDPRRKGEYELASPCETVDLPQTLLEPILIKHATQHGIDMRFKTTWQKYTTDASGITSTLYDQTLQTPYTIHSKYLFGADGARSPILKQLQLPLSAKPGKGPGINVLLRADLSKYMDTRAGSLHFIMQPDRPHPKLGWFGVARAVKPWFEWMFVLLPLNDDRVGDISREEYVEHIRALIGDEGIEIDILDISFWKINEISAEKYSKGNIFCLGDAVHRHPPMGGLGSNTCIQDAYNLAWKIAYVEKGIAGKTLLDSYTKERQPVGAGVVARANDNYVDYQLIWKAMGLVTEDIEERKRCMHEMRLATAAGRARRKAFHFGIERAVDAFQGLGVEMGQHYISDAIYSESGSDIPNPRAYIPSTIPGRRLPHAWLNRANPGKMISTHDLAGKGSFCLFTGHGGERWRKAAEKVTTKMQIPMNVYSIGYRQDWEDVYMEWARVRGIEEDGCVLVRPDRVVAWRCQTIKEDCTARLIHVMGVLLGISPKHRLSNSFITAKL